LLSSVPVVLAQQNAPQPEVPLAMASPDSVAKPSPHFFSEPQLSALRRLSDIIVPAIAGTPGALEAGAPEFLDFLIGQSPLPTRTLYRTGLEALNTRAMAQYGQPFARLGNVQADTLLGPLREPRTRRAHAPQLACSPCAGSQEDPADTFAVFLRHAKAYILTATMNSREWIAAASQRNRSASGIGMYWLPAE